MCGGYQISIAYCLFSFCAGVIPDLHCKKRIPMSHKKMRIYTSHRIVQNCTTSHFVQTIYNIIQLTDYKYHKKAFFEFIHSMHVEDLGYKTFHGQLK